MKKKILKVFAITIFTASLFSCGTNRNTTSASSSLEETTSENSSSTENYECISVERAIELALLIIEDLYDRNSTTVKENSTIEKLKADFILQLKVEGMDDLKPKDSDSKTQ